MNTDLIIFSSSFSLLSSPSPPQAPARSAPAVQRKHLEHSDLQSFSIKELNALCISLSQTIQGTHTQSNCTATSLGLNFCFHLQSQNTNISPIKTFDSGWIESQVLTVTIASFRLYQPHRININSVNDLLLSY